MWQEHVPVVEVALESGGCAVIPEADLEDKEAFALWSRFYFQQGIFLNPEWQAVARKLFAGELQECRSGDREAAAKLVALLPAVASFPEVLGALAAAAWAYDVESLEVLVRHLRRVRNRSPLNRRLGVKAGKAFLDVTRKRAERLFATPLLLSDAAAIKAVAGERIIDGGKAARIKKALRPALEKLRSFPRIIEGNAGEQNRRGVRFSRRQVAWEDAPRILWTKAEARELGIDPRAGVTAWPLPAPLQGVFDSDDTNRRRTR